MKRFTLLIVAILILALSATLAIAQTPEIEEKKVQLETLRNQMAEATPEEYETLKAQYEALGVEIQTMIGAIKADDQARSQAISEYNEGNKALRQRDYTRAIQHFTRSSELNSLEARTFYSLGIAHQMNRDLNAAEQAFSQAIILNSSYVKAYSAKSTILLKKREFAEAVTLLQRAVQIENADPADMSKAFGNLGRAYYYQKNYDRAINSYQQAVILNPQNADANYNMGKAYAEKGQFQDAANAIREAVNIEGRNHKYLTALAENLNKISSYSAAADAALRATQISPNYAAAWFELGWARQNMGQDAAAIEAYQKAMNDRNYRQPAEYQIKLINGEF
ncbi:TPR repeat-containing protein YrrB [bacterium BMS3Bbin04]|nr:TPR repeat-containing protein YrrB [bacterium BMS3Bbin04]